MISNLFCYFQILEQEKVHNLVTVKEFPLYMVPLDEDVISFELELSEKVCRLSWVQFLLITYVPFSLTP